MIQRLLTQAGLEEEEIAIYLAIVELKEATAGKIAQKSGIPRTYAYRILDELIDKGFVQKNDARSIRHFSVTDFDAPKRYLQKRQLELLKAEQAIDSLGSHLEQISAPNAPALFSESMKDEAGWIDFWRLLHSTITREIWVIHGPSWWGNGQSFSEVERWEQYRFRQHIWEKRFGIFETKASGASELKFTEHHPLRGVNPSVSFFLIDQYQVQVNSWEPFRALRIEGQHMVDLMKSMLLQE